VRRVWDRRPASRRLGREAAVLQCLETLLGQDELPFAGVSPDQAGSAQLCHGGAELVGSDGVPQLGVDDQRLGPSLDSISRNSGIDRGGGAINCRGSAAKRNLSGPLLDDGPV
jgi:hypothetical protein